MTKIDKTISFVVGEREVAFAACIFDFDGVIMDTEKYHYRAWNEACKPFGVFIGEEEYLPLKSTGRENFIAFAEQKMGRKMTEQERLGFVETKLQTFREGVRQLSEKDFIPGVLDFLARLSDRGVAVGVASSGSLTSSLIEKYGLKQYIAAVSDGNSPFPKKPAPDIFLATADALGVEPARCAVFEDSLSGVEGALAAGMGVVALGGIRPPRALLCIRDFEELSQYIR